MVGMTKARRRLLFITPWPPTGKGSGGQVVSGALLRLYQSRFDVDVIAAYGRGYEMTPDPSLGVVEWVPLRLQHKRHPFYGPSVALWAWLRGKSLRAEKMLTRRMRQAVSRAMARAHYDFVHVDMTLLRPIVPATSTPVIISAQNVEPEIFKRMAAGAVNPFERLAARLESRRVLNAERAATQSAQAVISMSERDAKVLRRLHHLPTPKVVPIYPAIADAGPIVSNPSSRGVILLGSLAAPGRLEGTLWFVESVWHLVRAAVPEARLEIVGSGPPQRLQRRSGMEGITVHGYLDDLDPVLKRSRVLAVPLRVGAGIRIKILEMLERGFPVVATTVAATGLKGSTWEVIDVADTAEQFSRRVIALLKDDSLWAARSGNGRRHVLDAYSPQRSQEAIDRVIAVAATSRNSLSLS